MGSASRAAPMAGRDDARVFRTAQARRRFFDEGMRPTGLVADPVIESWSRCLQAGFPPMRVPDFAPVTRRDVSDTRQRSRQLMQVATPVMSLLAITLQRTPAAAMLIDAEGAVVQTTYVARRSDEVIMPMAMREGASMSEAAVGTTAPGIALTDGLACRVDGSEHYFDCIGAMHCVAAPIHDTRGRLAGVLDLSVEGGPFAFDAYSLVKLQAAAIENRLLRQEARDCMVVQMQVDPALIGSPAEGVVGIGSNHRIAWANPVASRMLDLDGESRVRRPRADEVLGCPVDQLAGLSREDRPVPCFLPNGLAVWVRVSLPVGDRFAQRRAVPSFATGAADDGSVFDAASVRLDEPRTLRDRDRELIVQTLATFGGNITHAARHLGVSRGTIYRRLGEAFPPPVAADA